MEPSAAQTLALQALGWAAADGDVLNKFLEQSGLMLATLRERAADPELLAAFLDFLLSDDKAMAQFCASEATPPELVHAARRALPGAIFD